MQPCRLEFFNETVAIHLRRLPHVSIQDGCTRHDFFKRNGYLVHLLETFDLGKFLRKLRPIFRKLQPGFRKLRVHFRKLKSDFRKLNLLL